MRQLAVFLVPMTAVKSKKHRCRNDDKRSGCISWSANHISLKKRISDNVISTMYNQYELYSNQKDKSTKRQCHISPIVSLFSIMQISSKQQE